MRASHYLLVAPTPERRRRFVRPRGNATPLPCRIVGCGCGRFEIEDPALHASLCPICGRPYAARNSLEIHLSSHHSELSPRERSVLLYGALQGRVALSPSILHRFAYPPGGLATPPGDRSGGGGEASVSGPRMRVLRTNGIHRNG